MPLSIKVVTGYCGKSGVGWEVRRYPFYLSIPVDGVVTRLIFPSSLPLGNFPGMLSEVGSCFPGCQLSAALNKLVGFKVISWPSSNVRKSRQVLSLLQRWDEVCLL